MASLPAARPFHLVLNIVVVAVAARICSFIARWGGQPRILGDIIAGFLLSPDVMGERVFNVFCPPQNRPTIRVLGYIGLMMASMSAGSSFEWRTLRGRYKKAIVYSLLNICIPGALAIALASFLPTDSDFHGPDYDPVIYVLFLVCMLSSSALPFVFLILEEVKIFDDLAKFAIGVACLSTVFLFTVTSVANTMANEIASGYIFLRLGCLTLLIIGLLFVQRVWSWSILRYGPKSWPAKATTDLCLIIVVLCLLAGCFAERLGESFVLGTFLMGAALPFDYSIRTEFVKHVKWIGRWYLLPLFFFNIGLGFNLRHIRAVNIPHVVFIVMYGFLAKYILVPISKILLRFTWRESYFYASLVNCRGFNAMVIASVAQDTGQFGKMMYLACVMLSLVSSILAGPLAVHFHKKDDNNNNHTLLQVTSSELKKKTATTTTSTTTTTTTTTTSTATTSTSTTSSSKPPMPTPPSLSSLPLGRSLRQLFTWNRMKELLQEDPEEECGHLDVRAGLVLGKEDDQLQNQVILVIVSDIMATLRKIKLRPNGTFSGSAAVDLLMHSFNYSLRAVAINVCENLLRKKLIIGEHTHRSRGFIDGNKAAYVFGVAYGV